MKKLFTSESVTEGHPDKVADQISDAILDAIIAKDKNCRVACETLVSTGLCLVSGEISTDTYVDMRKIARETIRDIGYIKPEYGFDYETCAVLAAIDEQSPDIALGVDKEDQGAGDQGLTFGYAINETENLMPMSLDFAHKLTKRLAEVRKKKILDYLRPDGKSQVTIEYDNDKMPKRVEAAVIAAQHDDIDIDKVREDIKEHVVEAVIPSELLDNETKYHINTTGRFVKGGPAADVGLTGRKIIVDTYGGVGSHGGGCFSGKDPSKVDRSASYMARYIAKNIVAGGLADKCELQMAYAIGVSKPVSLYINCYDTNKVDVEKIEKAVENNFDLRPAKIIKYLDLLRPIYKKTASYGHFGRNDPDFTWEKTDVAETLRDEVGL
ncbi:MAG: methionine adenosyltransferase [Methanomicrobia archaeon]|nr:methionine adenosyltransferase [Methanomicrobia archaeon]